MYQTADRNGTITQERSLQDRFLTLLYRSIPGRGILRLLVSPGVSKLGGKLLDASVSRILIPPFIRSHKIKMTDFEQRKYVSYNDFFTRKIRPGARQPETDSRIFISPCDSRVSVYKINEHCSFFLKYTHYTVPGLLRSKKLAQAFKGGYIWIFRLCVADYHRYIYVDQGKVSKEIRIPGVLHTVNPIANDQFPIYKENTREYCLLKSDHFGTILQMEVGAMLVGKIINHPLTNTLVQRGQEKGYFAFGGSTVILMTQAGAVSPDEDLLENSRRGIETQVKMGERTGYALRRPPAATAFQQEQ